MRHGLLLALVAAALLWPPAVLGDQWQRLMDGAMQSHQLGNTASVERKLEAALALAENFAPDDDRLGQTLYALALTLVGGCGS